MNTPIASARWARGSMPSGRDQKTAEPAASSTRTIADRGVAAASAFGTATPDGRAATASAGLAIKGSAPWSVTVTSSREELRLQERKQSVPNRVGRNHFAVARIEGHAGGVHDTGRTPFDDRSGWHVTGISLVV